MFDAMISGTNPGFYHFMNLLYHCLACITFLWLLRVIGIRPELALAGALVFAVHPLVASAAFWIPARNDLLVTLFGLLFMTNGILWLKEKKLFNFIVAILAFTVALFSKESGVLLPLLLGLYLVLNRSLKPEKEIFMMAGGIGLVIIGWYALRATAITMHGSWQIGGWAILENFPFPLEIIAQFFLPVNFLAVTPVYSSTCTGLGVLTVIILLATFFMRKEKSSWLFVFGFLWYIAFSLPNMFVRLDTAHASYDYLVHRSYFPLTGFIIALLSLIPINWLTHKRRLTLILFGLLLSVLAGSSVILGTRYRNAETFWNSAITYNPNRAWFHHFLGRYYFKNNDFKAFEQHTRKALLLDRSPHFLYNLGMIYFLEKKSYDSAFLLFNEARATGFTDPEANKNYFNLCMESARMFFGNGDYVKAVERCKIATDLEPENSVAAFNMGLFLMYAGEIKGAAAWWRRSAELDPEMKETYRNLYYYYLNNTTMKDSTEYFATEYRRRGGVLELPAN
jgi:Flp pilus assembly protein TadD